MSRVVSGLAAILAGSKNQGIYGKGRLKLLKVAD